MDTRLKFAKGKLFSADPQLLQSVGDTLQNEYAQRCVISRVQPAREGDFFIYVTVYAEAAK